MPNRRYGGGLWVPAPSGAALALLTTERCLTSGLVILAPPGRVGPWLPAVGPDVHRLREQVIFSWLPITIMILAIVTGDPAHY